MLKSLYFKLNDENQKHKIIIDFFNDVKKKGGNKIDALSVLINVYNAISTNDKKQVGLLFINGTHCYYSFANLSHSTLKKGNKQNEKSI